MELERKIELIQIARDKEMEAAEKYEKLGLTMSYQMHMYSVRTYDSVLKLLKGE